MNEEKINYLQYETQHTFCDEETKRKVQNIIGDTISQSNKKIFFTTSIMAVDLALKINGSLLACYYTGECLEGERHTEIDSFIEDGLLDSYGAYINLRHSSGSMANYTSCLALAKPGDTILSWGSNSGAHKSQGKETSMIGILFNVIEYNLNEKDEIDFNQVEMLCEKHKPKIIITGASSYTRLINYDEFNRIGAKYGCYMIHDVAHVIGFMLSGLIPMPKNSHVITGSTYKSIPGIRGGLSYTRNKEIHDKINKIVIESQGEQSKNINLAKYVAIKACLTEAYQKKLKHSLAIAKFIENFFKKKGLKIIYDHTDIHMVCVDISSITNKPCFEIINSMNHNINIAVGVCTTPSSYKNRYGLRFICTNPAIMGITLEDIESILNYILMYIEKHDNLNTIEFLKNRVAELVTKYPKYIQKN